MFQVYFIFFLLIVCIPIGMFIITIIDKKNAKIFEEEKTIKKKCLQTEREERAEKFKEEVRIRMAELKEEEIQNKLLEEELAAKAKVIKKETKGKQVATTKVIKKEIKVEKLVKKEIKNKEKIGKERIDRILKESIVSLDHNSHIIDLAILFSIVNISATLRNHFLMTKNIKDDDYEMKMKTDYRIVVFTSCFYALSHLGGLNGCNFSENGLSKKSTRLYFMLGDMSYNSLHTRPILEIYEGYIEPELSDYFQDNDLLLHSILYYRMCIIFSEIFEYKVNLSSPIWNNSIENIEIMSNKLDEVVETLFNDSYIRNMLSSDASLDRIRKYAGFTGTCISFTSFIYKIKRKPTKESDHLTFEELSSVMDGFDSRYLEYKD